MSTPALNPLVEKIRAKYPGAYNDMDDAALTKAVLAKYPAYEDLARPNPATDKSLQPHLPAQTGPITRGIEAFGASAGDLLNAGAAMYGQGTPDSGQIGTPGEPKPPSIGRDIQSIKDAANGTYHMFTDPIQRGREGDIAGAIGEAIPVVASLGSGFGKSKAANVAANAGTDAIRATGRGMAEHPYVAGHVAGLGMGELIGHPWIGAAAGRYMHGPIRAVGERLSKFREPAPPFSDVPDISQDVFRESRPVSPQTAQPVGASIARPADIPAPYRIGPGAIPPDVVAAPNPRILAGNHGIRTTPIAMLPEVAGEDRLGSSAMMQHQGPPPVIPQSAAAPVRIGRPDILDDQAMQDAMNSDLESHGAQARREMNLERRARNDVSKPKWQLQAEAKAQQLMEQAQKKAEERTLTRELGKGQPKIAKPTKQGPPAVKITGQEQDLTPLLEKSLKAVKKKKG